VNPTQATNFNKTSNRPNCRMELSQSASSSWSWFLSSQGSHLSCFVRFAGKGMLPQLFLHKESSWMVIKSSALTSITTRWWARSTSMETPKKTLISMRWAITTLKSSKLNSLLHSSKCSKESASPRSKRI